jgi:hypothetical protein
MDADVFVSRWATAPISERAQYQTFISQLCLVLGVPAPDEDRPGDRDYGFERAVRYDHDDGGSHTEFIDCYRRNCFVLECKQSDKRRGGRGLSAASLEPRRDGRNRPTPERVDKLLRQAKREAATYARGLDEWPPFLVAVDVGRAIELWSDFERQGKTYAPYPDRVRHRIRLEQLRDPAVREMLARVWTDPMSLDPSRTAQEVTTEISTRLAQLVRSIGARAPTDAEGRVDPVHRTAWTDKTAMFVMQCLFAMFADSVGLNGDRLFLSLLESYRDRPEEFHHGARDLFRSMNKGGYCLAVRQEVRRFNGGLFRHEVAVEINAAELDALIAAARLDWRHVEPAIFGALLEQALDPGERAELGAHYTPRAYVEALVRATVMEPLRRDWEAIEGLAIGDREAGDLRGARQRVRAFHRTLCETRVLDPACGTGNFLYVAMDLMKALETEVLSVLAELGEMRQSLDLDGVMVGPGQFLGLEKNRRAALIAEVVMWIGHLQWHFRTHGRAQPSDPVLREFHAIRTRDALIVCDPDMPAVDLPPGPQRRAVWPEAEFIVGNPPFMGAKDQRRELGGAYVDALWAQSQGRFRSADLVMRWWDRAAEILTARGSVLRRFGFITTNSITQTFSRRVLEHHLEGSAMRLVFAVPDHPWVRGTGAASVRVSMTVAERGRPDGEGLLLKLVDDSGDAPRFRESRGVIRPDLTAGSDVSRVAPLRANAGLASRGVQLMGPGFVVSPETGRRLLAASDPGAESPLRPYRNGRDLTDRVRGFEVIDLYGWDEGSVRRRHPGIYQHLLETVRPDRDRNARQAYREAWWVFGEPRRELRAALDGLDRYIVTVETGKHRWFRFMEAEVRPDNRLVCIASDDPFLLGVLSSRVHVAWARATGGTLEDRPIYAKTTCFDRFAFPDATPRQREDIAVLAEELDRLRRDVLERNPDLTMTGLYNARERRGAAMSPEDEAVHQRGCIGVLDHLHARLDALVIEAYGWPQDVTEEAMIPRLAALNAERAAEEAAGEIRWLRPAFQRSRVRPRAGGRVAAADLPAPEPWPPLPAHDDEMATVLLEMLRRAGRPLQPRALAGGFTVRSTGRASGRIERVLAILAVAGSVHRTEAGWYAPRRIN